MALFHAPAPGDAKGGGGTPPVSRGQYFVMQAVTIVTAVIKAVTAVSRGQYFAENSEEK